MMTEEDNEEKDINSLSNSSLRCEKKNEYRKFEAKQETSSKTSSSLELSSSLPSQPQEGEHQIPTPSEKKRNLQSTSTTSEQALNVPSELTPDSATPLVNASTFQHALAVTDSIDEVNNSITDVVENGFKATDNVKNVMDLSEVRIMDSRKPSEKDMTKSNNSKSGRSRRRGGGNLRNMGARTLSCGSNSIRSIGSRNISRSSHCSISAHTMASSLYNTDSDLDSMDCENNSQHELHSDVGNIDYQNEGDQLSEQDREYLTNSDDDDDDIGEYDASWREKSQYDQHEAPNEPGAPPALSHTHRYSVAAEELLDASQCESNEPSITTAPSNTLEGEPLADLLLSQPKHVPDTSDSNEDMPLLATSPRETGGVRDNNIQVDKIVTSSVPISNDVPKTTEKHSKHQLAESENDRHHENKGINGVESQYSDEKFEHQVSSLTQQIDGANELSEQYCFDSEDIIRKEKLHDCEMPLEKNPNTSDNDSYHDGVLEFYVEGEEISEHAINSEHIRSTSSSSTSLYTLISSNRQDSLSDRALEVESSLISHMLRNLTSDRPSDSDSSSENPEDSDGEVVIETSTSIELLERPSSPASQASKPLSNLHDSQIDFSVSLSDDKKIAMETSISTSTRSGSWKDRKHNLTSHGENDKIALEASISISTRVNPCKEQDQKAINHEESKKIGGETSFSISSRSSSCKERNQKVINYGEDNPSPMEKRQSGNEGKGFKRNQVVPTEIRQSFGEKDPEIGEVSDKCCFMPCDEPISSDARDDQGVPEIHQKSIRIQGWGSVIKSLSPSDDFNCPMDYSVSHCTPSSTRIRGYVLRGLCSLLIMLTCGLTLYIFTQFDDNANEKYPSQIEPLFPAEP